jgi:uncharacterized membrane protein
MESDVVFLIFIAIMLVIVGPIFAITAFVRVQKIEQSANSVPRLTARVHELEKNVVRLEERLAKALAMIAKTGGAPVEISEAGPPSTQARTGFAPPATPGVLAQPASAAVPPPSKPLSQTEPGLTYRPPAPMPALTEAAATEEGEGFEALIAGRWFNYVGILALLFAVAFFLKYAFDNDWVGPRGRVGIGLLIGSALFPFSQKLLDRGYKFFSEGIAGLGAAVLYLSLWAGWHYYAIFSQSAAFALMIVVACVVATIAVGRDSERIAVLALLGGALTPEIVSTGQNQEVVLFTYLAVLGAALLVLARVRDWKTLPPIQFVCTLIYFWGWYSEFYEPAELARTLLYATIFFLLFAAIPVVRSYREGELSMLDGGIVLVNALGFLVALREMLWPEHRWGLTLAVLALAALHVASERALPEGPAEKPSLTRMLFAGLALLFATLVIPIRFDGRWITMAWAIEGAILIWSGIRIRLWPMRATGYFLFFVVACRVTFIQIHTDTFLFNARFALYAVCVTCFVLAWRFARATERPLGESEATVVAGIGIVANIGALAALSLEVWDLFGRMPPFEIDCGLAQELALSSLWLAYAIGLMAAGVVKKWAEVRWQALVLMAIVIGKVFLMDLSFLDRFYRIISFLLLGLALMMVSFYYQRRLIAQRKEKSTP